MSTIFPIIIWPFIEPTSVDHCEALVDFFAGVKYENMGTITIVVNHRSKSWIRGKHLDVIRKARNQNWRVRWVWSVDTCQTWLNALANSHKNCSTFTSNPALSQGNQVHGNKGNCTHLLVPADFHYANQAGQVALSRMFQAFDNIADPRFGLSIGQIQCKKNEIKELVDTLGTWKLVNLWFPKDEVALRKKQITKPRSEFLALSGEFLETQLKKKWFPYEQTLIMLLRLANAKAIDKVHVYNLGEVQEDTPVDPLAEFVTQVERMERAMKLYWRN